ncbi:MAG: RNA 2',3'-cyclic phosphodiesterase [Sphingomonas sp.]|nr:RNA 2',3'-cyclic phosphodiesterase [Sphingomonas sp.]
MYRLFVAIRLRPSMLDACLEAIADGPAGWAWQTGEQLHLTLRFIGEVEGPVAEDIAWALSLIQARPGEVALNGVGLFDQGRRSVLFARVAPREPLAVLHAKIDRALVQLGLELERCSYFPHITLARRRHGAADPASWLERHAGLVTPPKQAASFALYESHLTSHGPHYEAAGEYPLPTTQ